MSLHISEHAIERCCERLGARDAAEAAALLSGPVFDTALRIGARSVKFGNGARAVIEYTPDGPVVVTVLPRDCELPKQLRPASWGGSAPVGARRGL